MVLGERGKVTTERLDLAQQARGVFEPALMTIGILAGEAALELGRRGAGTGQRERTQTDFHDLSSPQEPQAVPPTALATELYMELIY